MLTAGTEKDTRQFAFTFSNPQHVQRLGIIAHGTICDGIISQRDALRECDGYAKSLGLIYYRAQLLLRSCRIDN